MKSRCNLREEYAQLHRLFNVLGNCFKMDCSIGDELRSPVIARVHFPKQSRVQVLDCFAGSQ